MRALAILLALALCACERAPTKTETGISLRAAGSTATVQTIALDDGTRCAVMVGPEGRGGIDCDWGSRKVDR